jgi:hypothetical protein
METHQIYLIIAHVKWLARGTICTLYFNEVLGMVAPFGISFTEQLTGQRALGIVIPEI